MKLCLSTHRRKIDVSRVFAVIALSQLLSPALLYASDTSESNSAESGAQTRIQGEASNVGTNDCGPLDGTYQYFGKGITHFVTGGGGYEKGSSKPVDKVAFDRVFRFEYAPYQIAIKLTYQKEKGSYEIKRIWKSPVTDPSTDNNKTHATYKDTELPVSCNNGRWLYFRHLEGASEGVRQNDNFKFYLTKNADGSLHVNFLVELDLTEALFIKSHRVVSSDFDFAPLELPN